MSAKDLADRLISELQASDSVNWHKARDEIHDAHDRATTIAERVLCLSLHKAIMDAVERQGLVAPEHLEEFRETRRRDYRLLLVKEAMIGQTDGHINPQKISVITHREVKEGRMSEDDELHKLAVAGEVVLGSPPMPHRRSVWKRIKSWWR